MARASALPACESAKRRGVPAVMKYQRLAFEHPYFSRGAHGLRTIRSGAILRLTGGSRYIARGCAQIEINYDEAYGAW